MRDLSDMAVIIIVVNIATIALGAGGVIVMLKVHSATLERICRTLVEHAKQLASNSERISRVEERCLLIQEQKKVKP